MPEPQTINLERGVEELLTCSRRVIDLTDDLCGRVKDEAAETLTTALQERDMLLVRLVELREIVRPMLADSPEREAISMTFRKTIEKLSGSDRTLMERLQERKQAAYTALIEAQRQQQLTNYIR